MPPPVAEAWGTRLVLVDGVHRLRAAHEMGLERAWVVVVRGDLPPLPCTRVSWPKLALTHRRRSRLQKFGPYAEELFRPVGSRLKGARMSFASVDDLVGCCVGHDGAAPA
jgi:hypothetical protein